jgi:hypothetical protein
MCLSTHRMTQPSSREVRDLLSKVLTQPSKHCWTRLEYICQAWLARVYDIECVPTDVHKLLHLLLLHAGLQLALLGCSKTGTRSVTATARGAELTHESIIAGVCVRAMVYGYRALRNS